MLLELLTWDRHCSKHLISTNSFNLQTHLITMKYVLLLFLTNSEVMEVMRSSRLAQDPHLVSGSAGLQTQALSLLGPLSFLSFSFFFFYNLFILFHCFWLQWAFVAAHGLSLIVASEGYSQLDSTGSRVHRLSICGSWALGCTGFRSCSTWVHQLWLSDSREHKLSSCGMWAQLLGGLGDLPRPGIEPVSLGVFLTAGPPGESLSPLSKLPHHLCQLIGLQTSAWCCLP